MKGMDEIERVKEIIGDSFDKAVTMTEVAEFDPRIPVRYIYDPQKDITVYELALIVPMLVHHSENMVDMLPPEAKRHFRDIG